MPARFVFCSSISAALDTPAPARIPEAPIKSLGQVSHTGYAASKLVGERIVQAAVENHGARATVLRIGQVVGDTKVGVWKDTEAFPLIIRSAVTMGILPKIDMTCQWLPVDTLAEAVLEIVGLSDGQWKTENGRQLIYNVLSPHTFSWTPELCSALHATNLSAFEDVSFKDWLAHLRSLSATTASCIISTESKQPIQTATQRSSLWISLLKVSQIKRGVRILYLRVVWLRKRVRLLGTRRR